MAIGYLHFDRATPHGQLFRQTLTQTENARDVLFDARAKLLEVRDVMIQMRDGDGSQVAQYAELTNRFGFPNDATAQACFLELDSACGNLSNHGVTVTQLLLALDQLFAKTRGL